MIPDNVEKIIITKENYDRNVEQLLVEKLEAEKEIERLNNIIQDTKEVLLTTNNVEKALNILDRKELKEGK